MARAKKSNKKVTVKDRFMAEAESALDEAIIDLIFKEPWYGYFLQRFERRYVNMPFMAGVTIQDNNVILLINPDKFDSEPLNIRTGILKHEALHIVNCHIMRQNERQHKLWNVSADMAINQFVGKENLPIGTIHWDEEPFKDDVPNLEPDRASEWYYEMIKQEAEKQGWAQGSSDANAGEDGAPADCDKDCSNCPMNGSDGEGNNTCDYKDGNPNASKGEGADGKDKKWEMSGSHDGWTDDSDGTNDKDAVAGNIKQAAQDAADTVSATGRGLIPGHIEDAIDKLGKPSKIRWQDVLRDFVSDSFDSIRESTFKRENRRIEGVYPGRKSRPLPQFTVAIDTSGSMSDREVSACLDECEAIAEQFNTDGFEVWQFDAAIQSVLEYKKGEYPKISGRGGTDFQPVIDKCVKEELSCIIIMTDAGAPAPEYKGIKCYWVITEGGWSGYGEDNDPGAHLDGRKVQIDLSGDDK